MDLLDQPMGRENMKGLQVYYREIYEYGQKSGIKICSCSCEGGSLLK